jgi:predicted ATP-dependent Lon-type protease
MVSAHERMLTGGFYAEITLEYDAAIAQEKNGKPFGITSLRPIQLSKKGALEEMARGRQEFTTEEWKDFLLQVLVSNPTSYHPVRKMSFYYAWCRLSSEITILWNSGHAEQASLTCFNKFHLTPISCRGVKPLSPGCS